MNLETSSADTTFDKYRIELGGAVVNSAINFDDQAPSPLFNAPSVSAGGNAAGLPTGNEVVAEAGGSEWDYLWRNASRIPITSIPEPTAASLLVGGGMLLWMRRARKPIR